MIHIPKKIKTYRVTKWRHYTCKICGSPNNVGFADVDYEFEKDCMFCIWEKAKPRIIYWENRIKSGKYQIIVHDLNKSMYNTQKNEKEEISKNNTNEGI